MRKIVLFTIVFLVFLSNDYVYAIDMCTPSDEYLEYMKLSDDEKSKVIEPIYCSEISDSKSLLSGFKNGLSIVSGINYPSRYNSYDEGYVTEPKNQGHVGACWSFSAISNIETNALKNGLKKYDFSEAHMLYSLVSAGYSDDEGKAGKYVTNSLNGGKVTYPATYYFNNVGQLLEDEWPFPMNDKTITSSEYKKGKDIITVKNYYLSNLKTSNEMCTNDDIAKAKDIIYNTGSIQATIYMDEALFSDSKKNYYLASSTDANSINHAVVIVGWDDSISKSNFNGATRDGAWIVKNSWGTTWSEDGFFYISYDDNFICNTFSYYDGVSEEKFDYSYKASDVVSTPYFVFEGKAYISSRFKKNDNNSNEILKRVSFGVGENQTYKVYIAKDEDYKNSSNWTLLTTGTSLSYGIISYDLEETYEINDDFALIVEYIAEEGEQTSSLMMCNQDDDTKDMNISSNTNFFSVNGNSWFDMNSMVLGDVTFGCEPNFYLYTNKGIEDLKISLTNNNDKIEITLSKIINTNLELNYKIVDEKNNDVTNHFTITPSYTDKKITIVSDNTISGNYKFILNYNGITLFENFNLVESFSVNNNEIIFNDNTLTTKINYGHTFTYKELLDSINVKNSNIKIINAKGEEIKSDTTSVGTNSKIILNNHTYNVIIKGDVNGDGRISALDYIEIRKHIMNNYSYLSNENYISSADLDNNLKISALDYIAVKKIMMNG